MKKIVLKLAIEDESSKNKALKLVTGVHGVDSVAVDMKENNITVIGDMDPVCLTSKLRKFGFTDLLIMGLAKEEKKGEKKEKKKEEKKAQGDAKKENKAESPKNIKVVYVPITYNYGPYQYTVVRE